jgi:SH3-like domain-containing protein
MSILPIVKQDLEENLQVDEEIIESETEEQSEEEVEPIIEVKQRKKAVRNEIFDIKDEPEPVEPEPEPIKQKPQKRKPAKFYEEGYREGDFRVMIDKNGSKRWVNDKTLENARARMNEMHKKGIARPPTRKKKAPPVEVQLKEVLEKQEQNKNNLSEEFIKKYQEDLMNVVKTASLNAVEEYDTKRKARKAEKKAQQKAEIVQSQMRSKLEGLQRPVKYGKLGISIVVGIDFIIIIFY